MDEEGTVASVSLLIVAQDLDPEVVTKVLRLFPDKTWQCGWKKWIPEDRANRRVEEQLEFWATLLRDRSSQIEHLSNLGYEIVLDCYVAPKFPFLLELSGSLQAQIGALHINVDMHFFADESSEMDSGMETERASSAG